MLGNGQQMRGRLRYDKAMVRNRGALRELGGAVRDWGHGKRWVSWHIKYQSTVRNHMALRKVGGRRRCRTWRAMGGKVRDGWHVQKWGGTVLRWRGTERNKVAE